jgi:hypothetical protein
LKTLSIPLLLAALVACTGGPPDLGDMPRKVAIAACNEKLEQVTSDKGVNWAPQRAVADKHDRYWKVEGKSTVGHYYSCLINAVNGDFLTYVY